ncbi:MAG: c-type cytochrome [Thermoanaerobaculia bacterium]
MRTILAPLAALLLVLGCTTAQPPAKPASEFKNLQVLPPEISRDELVATMRSFTRSLGVKCNECHVVTATDPEEKLDFPSDAKEEKRVARVMIQMTRQINGGWMERVEAAEGEHHEAPSAEASPEAPKVSCWTCHRGKTKPEAPPPPPAR